MSSFERRKNRLCGHLLIKASRLYFSHSTRALSARSGLGLSESHFRVFPYIDAAGSSLTEVAEKMDISKQAVSKLVKTLVEKKILYLEPSKSDGRSKRVKFRATKGSPLSKSLDFLQEQEQVFKKILGGRQELESFKEALFKIQTHYEKEVEHEHG